MGAMPSPSHRIAILGSWKSLPAASLLTVSPSSAAFVFKRTSKNPRPCSWVNLSNDDAGFELS